MDTQAVTDGMDRIDIKAALERKGWSLRRLSVTYGYSHPVAGRALRQPYPNAEWIIADALELPPWKIWPERYPNGPVLPPESIMARRNMANLNAGDKK